MNPSPQLCRSSAESQSLRAELRPLLRAKKSEMVTSLRTREFEHRTVFVDTAERPQRLWTHVQFNGATLTVATCLTQRGKSWHQQWVLAHRRRANVMDRWGRAILRRPIPIRTEDAIISDRRIELQMPWPWRSRFVFYRPSSSLRDMLIAFLGRSASIATPIELHVDGIVIGSLGHSMIRIRLYPGVGLADAGIDRDVPLSLIPPAFRVPNTRLRVLTRNGDITAIQPADGT